MNDEELKKENKLTKKEKARKVENAKRNPLANRLRKRIARFHKGSGQ